MPRSDRSPGEYSSHRGTPKKGPPSDRSSDYDSEEDDGPTLFGSILRTLMAGGAVVAIAVLAKIERDQRNGVAPPSYTRRSYPSYATRKPAVSSVGGGSKSAKTGSAAAGESRGGGSYQVREGDTLYRIAVTHDVDPDTLQAMNPELAGRAHAIQVGEYVRVPRK